MINNAVQRLTVTNEGCTVVTSVGSGVQNTAQNEEDSGELDASSVRFSQVAGVEVSATRVIVSTNRGFVDIGAATRFLTQIHGSDFTDKRGGVTNLGITSTRGTQFHTMRGSMVSMDAEL